MGPFEIQLNNDKRLKSALHKLVLVLPLTVLIFEQALLNPDAKIKLPIVDLELHVKQVTPIFVMLISFMLYRALRYARIILWSAMYSVRKTDTVVQIALDETEAYKVNSRYRMLDADRPDLELAVLTLQDHAVVVVRLGLDDFAQVEVHPRMILRTGREHR